jgi:hypothetical protein
VNEDPLIPRLERAIAIAQHAGIKSVEDYLEIIKAQILRGDMPDDSRVAAEKYLAEVEKTFDVMPNNPTKGEAS